MEMKMKNNSQDEIFYFYNGDDIKRYNLSTLNVYNTEIKSDLIFTSNQLSLFCDKLKDN